MGRDGGGGVRWPAVLGVASAMSAAAALGLFAGRLGEMYALLLSVVAEPTGAILEWAPAFAVGWLVLCWREPRGNPSGFRR